MHHILSYLHPVHVETVQSSINGTITVELYRSRYRTRVGGYIQSGEFAQHILDLGMKNIHADASQFKKVLILGLAAGSMVKRLHTYLSGFTLTGVDLDPAMIHIGKKYFHLQEGKNLKIHISDAYDFMKNMAEGKTFHLVISDLFIGCETGQKLLSEAFVRLIYKHVAKGGMYIANMSYNKPHKNNSDLFWEKVKKRFETVDTIDKHYNLIIRAYK
jgi:spermidine synthase